MKITFNETCRTSMNSEVLRIPESKYSHNISYYQGCQEFQGYQGCQEYHRDALCISFALTLTERQPSYMPFVLTLMQRDARYMSSVLTLTQRYRSCASVALILNSDRYLMRAFRPHLHQRYPNYASFVLTFTLVSLTSLVSLVSLTCLTSLVSLIRLVSLVSMIFLASLVLWVVVRFYVLVFSNVVCIFGFRYPQDIRIRGKRMLLLS